MPMEAREPIRAVDEERLDLISSQGPGGQFIQEDHTLRFFRREMWIPTLSDRAATVAWMQDKRLSTRERARQ
jgi:trimethylamine:corrinoid methyltransferase-like protein